MPEGNNVGRCRGGLVEGRNAGGQCIGEGRGGEVVQFDWLVGDWLVGVLRYDWIFSFIIFLCGL